MELFLAITIGVLFAAGTYLILRPNLIRVVLGMGLYSNAVNLLMISTGGFSRTLAAPFAPADESGKLTTPASQLMDPLPPDIILTAIVISFAVGALFLTLCYRVYKDHGTDNPELLPNHETPEETAASNPFAAALATAPVTEGHGDHGDVSHATHSDGSHAAHGEASHRAVIGQVPDVCAELAKASEHAPREPSAQSRQDHAAH